MANASAANVCFSQWTSKLNENKKTKDKLGIASAVLRTTLAMVKQKSEYKRGKDTLRIASTVLRTTLAMVKQKSENKKAKNALRIANH